MKKILFTLCLISIFTSCTKEEITNEQTLEKNQTKSLSLTTEESNSLLFHTNNKTISTKDVLKSINIENTKSANKEIKSIEAIKNANDTIAYIINYKDNNGFVIVGAKSYDSKIVAFSKSGNFETTDKFSKLTIESVKEKNLYTKKHLNEVYKKTLNKISDYSGKDINTLNNIYTKNKTKGPKGREYFTEVTYTPWEIKGKTNPLIKTFMHKGSPYNDAYDTNYSTGTKDEAGKDAIIMSQIAVFKKPSNYPLTLYINGTTKTINPDWNLLATDFWTTEGQHNTDVGEFVRAMGQKIGAEKGFAPMNKIAQTMMNLLQRPFIEKNYDNIYAKYDIINNINNWHTPTYMRCSYINTTTPYLSWIVDGTMIKTRIRINRVYYYDINGNKVYEPGLTTDSLCISEFFHLNIGYGKNYKNLYCSANCFIFSCPIGYDFNYGVKLLYYPAPN